MSPIVGPADQQQRLYSRGPFVRSEPDAAADDDHVVGVVAVAEAAVGPVGHRSAHQERRRPGHVAAVLGHVRQPVPAAQLGAVAAAAAATAAALAEVRRVRPPGAAALQRGQE